MIERAARCLEIGGRAAFRGYKKQIRTRRHLHSAFWSHGAGNINLPAWWILLLQTPDTAVEGRIARKKNEFRTAVSENLEEMFLDFLYPLQTLALLKQIKRATTAHQLAAQSAKRCTRSYTSIAQTFITGGNVASEEGDSYSTVSPSISEKTGDALRHRINHLLDSNTQSGLCDEIWQSYQDILETSQMLLPQELIRMLRCLTSSDRSVDIERALALYESISVQNRRAIHYSLAVSAAVTLKDLDTAICIHREALSRVSGSIGTAAILGFTVEQELWAVAIEAWGTLWEHKLSYYTRPDIWTAVDALPSSLLISKASSAADFAMRTSESTESREATAARDFALELARRAFKIPGTTLDVSQHWDLIEKVRVLDAADSSLCTLALEQLLSVNSREHGQRALDLYHILRKKSTFSPTRYILESISRRIFRGKSTRAICMILDDWRTHFTTLPGRLATRAAKILASSGHIEAVQALFQDFISRHGELRHNTFYDCMLLAHSRRADPGGAVRCLHYLQNTFAFKPDVKAWNSVISAHARVGDIDGALKYLQKSRDAGTRPDSTTYFILMSMYAKRGDRDAVDELYEYSKVEGVPTTLQMIDTIVLANIHDENLGEAERLVEQTVETDVPGSRTFMWNMLLNTYAVRKEIEKVSQLHKRMHEVGVPYDNMTYAALLTSLTVAKYPDGARKILRNVMPRDNIKRTALHYAIVMRGYLLTGQHGRIFQLYKEMLSSNLSPNVSTQNVLLRAAASIDKASPATAESEGASEDLERAQRMFEQTLTNLDPMELAASEPRMFVGPSPLNEAFTSTYFEYLIFLYGTEAAFHKVSELYEQYVTKRRSSQSIDQDVEAIPPIRLLTALMVSHLRAEKYFEIDRCWDLAVEKSEQLSCRYKADTSHGGWVLHSRRFIINLPLHHYIISLIKQHRIVDLISTVQNLRHAGYALNSSNWNKYIQALAQSPELAHRILAFEHCEIELISKWRGWSTLGDPKYMKPKLHRAQRLMLLRQDQKAPTYLTLVWLARTYSEARSQGRGGTMRALERVGPRTVDAVTNMPRLNDKPQSEVLRQET